MRAAPFFLVAAGCMGTSADTVPPHGVTIGFEEADATGAPLGWTMRGGPFALVDECAHGGRRSLRLHADDPDQLTAATVVLPAECLVGKRVRVSTWLRTLGVVNMATPWLRADEGERAMDAAYAFPAHGTVADWTGSFAEIEVPPARTVSLGVALVGAGTAWFDDVRIEVIEPSPVATITLSGCVTDGSGRPVDRAQVALLGDAGVAQRVRTAADGAFVFHVAPGSHAVSACVPGDATLVGNFVPRARYDADASGIGIVLAAGDGVLVRGQVTGPLPSDGHVEIARYSRENGDTFVLPLAPDGTFAARLPRGERYRVRMLAAGQSSADALCDGGTAVVSLPATPPPAPPPVVDWIAANAVQFAHGEAGHGTDDMAPLAGIVGDAAVVGLGEATHGSHEMFTIKHRLVEYLVARQGFTVLAFEGGFAECAAIDDYVQHGIGDPGRLLARLHWVWDTEEVLALVGWLRAWNADARHVDKVHLVGIDMQESGGCHRLVADFLARVAPAGAAAVLAPIDVMGRALVRNAVEALAAERQQQLVGALEALAALFDRNEPDWTHATSDAAFASARQAVTVMQQAVAEAMTGPPGAKGQAVRDRAMADNVAWIRVRSPGARVAVWAHGFHLRVEAPAPGAMRQTGSYLRERYGDDYLSLGMVFGHGSFAALDANHHSNLEVIDLPPAPDHYLSAAFTRAGVRCGVLDLRRLASVGDVEPWFRSPHPVRECGYVFRSEEAMTRPRVLPSCYDAVVYLEQVTRSRPRPADRSRLP